MALTGGAGGAFTWAVAERPGGGAADSGDAFIVVDRRQGPLVAVVDGLGHGPEAARAARAGVDALRRHCHDPLGTLLDRCATAVQGTRGVVATVCSFDTARSRLAWTAIGNVAGLLCDRNGDGRPWYREVVPVAGIVGATMPPARVATVDLRPGSLLVLATDGVDPDFREAIDESADPEVLADRILSCYGHDRDDALVLIGLYDPATPCRAGGGER